MVLSDKGEEWRPGLQVDVRWDVCANIRVRVSWWVEGLREGSNLGFASTSGKVDIHDGGPSSARVVEAQRLFRWGNRRAGLGSERLMCSLGKVDGYLSGEYYTSGRQFGGRKTF